MFLLIWRKPCNCERFWRSFKEIATKAIGTPVNLKFREITTFENMTILGDVSDEMKENLAAMGPKFRTYKAGLN